MVFYTGTNDKNNLISQCNMLIVSTKQSLTFQKKKRKILRHCLDKICYTIDSIVDVPNVNTLFSALDDVKNAIKASDFNINSLIEIQNALEKLSNTISKDTIDNIYVEIEKLNNTYSSIENTITENTNIMDEFFLQFIDNCNFYVKDSTMQVLPSGIQLNSKSSENLTNSDNKILQDKINPNFGNISSSEKTLLISEKTQKVYLPYNLEDVQKTYNSNPNKYTDLEDVISKEYTVPLSNYKTPSLSRFKEAFNLMRNKEHSSFLDSLNLALELSHNSLLNPAIITACKNLDELDIYLDCLDSNELDKFNLFKIVFDILPSKK